jgi:hypothetical protein
LRKNFEEYVIVRVFKVEFLVRQVVERELADQLGELDFSNG